MSTLSTSESRDCIELRTDGEGRLRVLVYGLLARLLSAPPDTETLHLLSLIHARDTGDEDDLAAYWRELQTATATAEIDRLGDEYFSLFVGLGRGELVPYASWYMTGALMERPLVILRDDLASLGFERQKHVHEPEDHAAALCDVMALLHDGQDGVDDATAARFFRRHVGPWMGMFFDDMRNAASAGFYRAVGRFGRRFLEIETAYFGSAPDVASAVDVVPRSGSDRSRDVGVTPNGE